MNDQQVIEIELRNLNARVEARLAQTAGLSDRFRELGAQGEPIHALHEAVRELEAAAELIAHARHDADGHICQPCG